MSVFAAGLMRKAQRERKKNFKETRIYETNAEKSKREARDKKDIKMNHKIKMPAQKVF